jgi:hypothetical protein
MCLGWAGFQGVLGVEGLSVAWFVLRGTVFFAPCLGMLLCPKKEVDPLRHRKRQIDGKEVKIIPADASKLRL